MKNEPNWYYVPYQKKGSKTRSARFKSKISLIFFSKGSGPPLKSSAEKKQCGQNQICWKEMGECCSRAHVHGLDLFFFRFFGGKSPT